MGELTRIYPSTAQHMSRSVSKQPKKTDHNLARKFVVIPGDWQVILGWVCIMFKVIIRLRKRVHSNRKILNANYFQTLNDYDYKNPGSDRKRMLSF